jgi:hypothetical protein
MLWTRRTIRRQFVVGFGTQAAVGVDTDVMELLAIPHQRIGEIRSEECAHAAQVPQFLENRLSRFGIGRATALRFAREGASVVVTGPDQR